MWYAFPPNHVTIFAESLRAFRAKSTKYTPVFHLQHAALASNIPRKSQKSRKIALASPTIPGMCNMAGRKETPARAASKKMSRKSLEPSQGKNTLPPTMPYRSPSVLPTVQPKASVAAPSQPVPQYFLSAACRPGAQTTWRPKFPAALFFLQLRENGTRQRVHSATLAWHPPFPRAASTFHAQHHPDTSNTVAPP